MFFIILLITLLLRKSARNDSQFGQFGELPTTLRLNRFAQPTHTFRQTLRETIVTQRSIEIRRFQNELAAARRRPARLFALNVTDQSSARELR